MEKKQNSHRHGDEMAVTVTLNTLQTGLENCYHLLVTVLFFDSISVFSCLNEELTFLTKINKLIKKLLVISKRQNNNLHKIRS